WAGGYLHLGLERSLKDAGVPIYGFLAYMRAVRDAFDAPADAASLLHDPAPFGLADRRAIEAAAKAAKEFVEAREPTNVPARGRFLFLRGADPGALPRVDIDGRTYLIEGRIGGGDKADVYRGAWDHPLTERVVIKAARDASSSALMAREVATLEAFGRSRENGTPFFTRLLPEVVASGTHEGKAVTVFRYKNRYDWTLEDAIREYPGGVDPETMVWMWNRTLTLLAWVHMNRMVHGAIVPGHILIHPLNHGATLLDWAYAVRVGKAVEAEPAHAAFQPDEVLRKEAATPETDIAMSARCMIAVLGGDPATGDLPGSVPAPIAAVLRLHARFGAHEGGRRIADALTLEKEFGKIAEGVFGPRRYHPFQMPRRSR
ncbi:MAG TPA: hypothetical protein VLC10_04845, partial [Patescibacteria group bacterium]|nr:hypothetical protein [Patescibacteria group bacterium]